MPACKLCGETGALNGHLLCNECAPKVKRMVDLIVANAIAREASFLEGVAASLSDNPSFAVYIKMMDVVQDELVLMARVWKSE